MNRSFKGFVLLATLLTFAPQALPEARSENHDELPPRINVRVHNYAQLSNEILTQAEVKAAEILGKAGIEITWTNCDPTRKDLGDAAECNQLQGPTNLGVGILPYFGVIPGTDKETMGFALGNLASVSVRRVSEEAAEFGVQPYEVLGPAIAHELGHSCSGSGDILPAGSCEPTGDGRTMNAPREAPSTLLLSRPDRSAPRSPSGSESKRQAKS